MDNRHVLTPLRVAVAVAAVTFAVVWRLVKNDLGAPPNLELTTAATFLAMVLLRRRVMVVVPLAITIASDLILGNTSIAMFTWSAWLLIGVMALVTRPRNSLTRQRDDAPGTGRGLSRIGVAAGFGAGASLVFFVWTNLGVWLQGRGVYYPAGLDGLAASYVAGLPFWRTMMVGNLVFLPLAAGVVAVVELAERRAFTVAQAA